MPTLPTRTFEQIVADQKATLSSSLSVNTDIFDTLNLTPGSPLLALMEANSAVVLFSQYINWKVLRNTRMQTSVGNDLDTFGADFLFARYPAIPATGQVFFNRSTANNTFYVPLNTVVTSNDGTQSYVVISPLTDTQNIFDPVLGYRMDPNVFTISVLVQGVTPGSAGNIGANSVKLQSSLAVNNVNNPVQFVNGQDQESDQKFISRFRTYIDSLSRATPAALENAIIATNPAYTFTILENFIAVDQPQPGCVLVNFDDGTGLSLQSATDQVQTIANELKNNLEEVRAVGVTLFVQPAQALSVSVQFETTFANTALRLMSVGQIKAAVVNYINSLGVGESLFKTKLIQVIYNSTPNLINISDTSFVMTATDQFNNTLQNTPQGDILINAGQVLRFLQNPNIRLSTVVID